MIPSATQVLPPNRTASPAAPSRMPLTTSKRVTKVAYKSKAPNCFQKLWQKICDWFKKMWQKCFGKKDPSVKLNANQLKLIQDFKKSPWVHQPLASTKKINNLTPASSGTTIHQSLPKSPLQPTKQFDPVLQEVRDFMQDFQDVFIDAWSDEFLVPKCDKISQSLITAEKGLKAALDWVAKLGVKSSKPMFQIVKLTTTPTVSNEVDKSVENFFKWLLKGENQKQLQTDLTVKLKEDIKLDIEKRAKMQIELQVPAGQDLAKDYVAPLVEWLVNTNHSQPVLKMFEGKNPNLALVDQTLETLIKLVLERKINGLSDKIHTIFKDKLDIVIRDKLIKANAVKFTDILSGRLADVIDSIDWPNALDQIFTALGEHTKDYIAADQAVQNNKHFQENLEVIHQAKEFQHVAPKPGDEEEKAKLMAFLQDVEASGGEEALIQKELQKNFAAQSKCHPIVKTIISGYLNNNLTTEQAKQNQVLLEKAQFAPIVEKVMDALFPPMIITTPEGEKKEVDGLEMLWDELIIPQEFYDLQNEAESIVKEIISHESYDKMQDLWQNFLPKLGIKQLIVSAARQKIREVATNVVHSMVTNLIQPDNIKQIIAANLIPEISNALLGAFIKGRIAGHQNANLHAFSKLFHAINCAKTDKEKEIARNALYPVLMEKTFAALNLYKKYFTEEEFKKRAKPHLDTLEKLIEESQNQKGAEPLTLEEVQDILGTFYKKSEVQHNPKNVELFGELFMDFGFKIGGFADDAIWQKAIENFADGKLKTNIGKMLDQQVQPFQKSYHMPLHNLTKLLRNKLLGEEGKQNIKRMLTKKPTAEVKPEDQEAKIAKQKEAIEKIAALAHDLISYNIGENVKNKAWVFGNFAGAIAMKATQVVGIGGDHKQLQKTIEKSVNKILGNSQITENLVFKITDIVSNHLTYANQQLKAKNMITNDPTLAA